MLKRLDQTDNGVFNTKKHFSPECLKHYQSQGWVLLKKFYNKTTDLQPIHYDVNRLLSLKLAEIDIHMPLDQQASISNDDFLVLCARNREKGGEIYRATRHFSSTHKLLVKEKNLQLAKLFMQTDAINVIPYVPLRIDIKGEEEYLFDWHQDYPYTQGSTDGIVIWAPLFDVENGEGGVKFKPGSHQLGILPVIVNDHHNSQKNGAHSIRLADLTSCDNQDAYTIDVAAGDALVFSTLLLHKSLPLNTSKIRWTTQLRYGNFYHPDSVQRGWPGGMIEGCWFEKDHPEFISKDIGKR